MSTTNPELKPGDTAPGFTLINSNNEPVSLATYQGQQIIVYFYPAAGTPGCTTEACDFQDNLATLNNQHIQILGISPDKPEKLHQFAEKYSLTFPLLSDPNKAIAKKYGAYGTKNLYGKITEGIKRSTFLIDPNGKIQLAKYNVKATGHVARLIQELTPSN